MQQRTTKTLHSDWRSAWLQALELWNTYIKLREPIWCQTEDAARKEGLSGSFAMIRLTDHLVVIDLFQVDQNQVNAFGLQILAHEIGHHVYIPANLHDNARLLARMRWGLAGIEDRAPLVANLYADQLINHHLHQDKGLDMAAVFKKLGSGITPSPVWTWMLRCYEYLWRLEKGWLIGKANCSEEMDADASLGASLIRSYARHWLDGAGRYAALLYPYLLEDADFTAARQSIVLLADATECGAGGAGISGLARMDEAELGEIVDPRLEALGKAGLQDKKAGKAAAANRLPDANGDVEVKQRYRNPGVYIDLMQQVDPLADAKDLIVRYYRELALPHLVPFPTDDHRPFAELLPEGTDSWENGDPMEELDYLESALVSPQIIPGYTTRKRVYGTADDSSDDPTPLDLYVGIDCSGSMVNPAQHLSWPVLAGAVVGLSALRAGASVKAVLSGEPGRYMETNGFVNTENEVLAVLTDYLGTGYAFGISRLETDFNDQREKKTHIMIITDDDIFSMLGANAEDGRLGWDIAEQALPHARGGGTIVLHSQPKWREKERKQLQDMGWRTHCVTDEEELLAFAAAFAKSHYGIEDERP